MTLVYLPEMFKCCCIFVVLWKIKISCSHVYRHLYKLLHHICTRVINWPTYVHSYHCKTFVIFSEYSVCDSSLLKCWVVVAQTLCILSNVHEKVMYFWNREFTVCDLKPPDNSQCDVLDVIYIKNFKRPNLGYMTTIYIYIYT